MTDIMKTSVIWLCLAMIAWAICISLPHSDRYICTITDLSVRKKN